MATTQITQSILSLRMLLSRFALKTAWNCSPGNSKNSWGTIKIGKGIYHSNFFSRTSPDKMDKSAIQ